MSLHYDPAHGSGPIGWIFLLIGSLYGIGNWMTLNVIGAAQLTIHQEINLWLGTLAIAVSIAVGIKKLFYRKSKKTG